MKKMRRNIIFVSVLICLLLSLFILEGCWVRVWKRTTITVIVIIIVTQEELWVRFPEPHEWCRLLRGVKIPVEWDIYGPSTFELNATPIPIHEDTGVKAELDALFPPEPGYKWVGFATDDSLYSGDYPDSVQTKFVYPINRNLPAGPREAIIYEKSGEDYQHHWGGDAQFMVKSPTTFGDVNCDDVINVGDVLYLINYLFKFGPPPCSL